MLRRLVAIVGATGTGKSAIALELTQRLGGEVVNADSRQVYRGMDIGTAKPTLDERRRARHHLYDVADPADGYSLALYQQQAKETLNAVWSRNAFAWLVGGTGQYVWSLLEAWQVPDVAPDEALRAEMEAFAAENGYEALASRLAMVDPAAADRIDHRNVRRVIRAIEVYEKSGRTMTEWQTKGTPDFEFLLFGIDVPRDVLYPRVDRRVDAMFEGGLVEEVQALLASGVPAGCPVPRPAGPRQAKMKSLASQLMTPRLERMVMPRTSISLPLPSTATVTASQRREHAGAGRGARRLHGYRHVLHVVPALAQDQQFHNSNHELASILADLAEANVIDDKNNFSFSFLIFHHCIKGIYSQNLLWKTMKS